MHKDNKVWLAVSIPNTHYLLRPSGSYNVQKHMIGSLEIEESKRGFAMVQINTHMHKHGGVVRGARIKEASLSPIKLIQLGIVY